MHYYSQITRVRVRYIAQLALACFVFGCSSSDSGSDSGLDTDLDPDSNTDVERTLYTAGHADIAVALAVVDGSVKWDAFLASHGATVGGESVTDGLSLKDVAVWSSARFSRPAADSEAFEELCVSEGEELAWLPQGLRAANTFEVPFLGIAAAAHEATLVDDIIAIHLVDVESPSGTGAYSLWRDGFPPKFFMSSCDGIDENDRLPLALGHDHYNMGFSEPGKWSLTYEASAQLLNGKTASVRFDVHYVLDEER